MPHHRPILWTWMIHRNRRQNLGLWTMSHDKIGDMRILFVPMHLYDRQARIISNGTDQFLLLIYEHTHLLHRFWQVLHNLPRRLDRHTARALFVEHKPHRVRAGVYRCERVLQIRHSANLDPGHCETLKISDICYSHPSNTAKGEAASLEVCVS